MKVLDELRLRESLLLNYRERLSLSSKMVDCQRLNEVDDVLFLLQAKIWEVERNKLKFIDNSALLYEWIQNFDRVYKILN